jgi:hypothetical protein
MMNRTRGKPVVVALWKHCRFIFASQPAPWIWFDPRPGRRVRINVWRRFDAQRSTNGPRRG